MSYVEFVEQSSVPAVPSRGKHKLYFDTNERLAQVDWRGRNMNISSAGMRDWNLITNGDFHLAQRQVPTTLTSYAGSSGIRVYTADRWGATVQTTSAQFQNVQADLALEPGLSSAFYGRFKQITSAGKIHIAQPLEWAACGHLPGRTVILQFKVKQSLIVTLGRQIVLRFGILAWSGTVDAPTGQPGGSAYITYSATEGLDPTYAANFTAIAPNVVSDDAWKDGNGATTSALTSDWAQYWATFTIPANAKNVIPCFWTNQQLIINEQFEITEVGMYDDEYVRDWMPRPIQLELELCHRYYFKSFNIAVAPTGAATNGYFAGPIGKVGTAALSATLGCRWPTRMRAVPTVTQYSCGGAGSAPFRLNGTTPAIQTAPATVAASEEGCTVTATGTTSGTVGDHVGVHLSAEAEL